MRLRLAHLITGLFLAAAGQAHGQGPRPLAAAVPPQFESWRPAAALDRGSTPATGQFVAASRNRARQAGVRNRLGDLIGCLSGSPSARPDSLTVSLRPTTTG